MNYSQSARRIKGRGTLAEKRTPATGFSYIHQRHLFEFPRAVTSYRTWKVGRGRVLPYPSNGSSFSPEMLSVSSVYKTKKSGLSF